MKKNEPYKIFSTCSPSETPIVVNIKNIIVVTMSCGGGFGGSKWDEHFDAVELDSIPTSKIMVFTDAISGKKKAINTNYIVKVEEKQMLKVYQDITKWKNYNKKVCNKCYTEMYLAIDKDMKWVCVDEYNHNDDDVIVSNTYEE